MQCSFQCSFFLSVASKYTKYLQKIFTKTKFISDFELHLNSVSDNRANRSSSRRENIKVHSRLQEVIMLAFSQMALCMTWWGQLSRLIKDFKL